MLIFWSHLKSKVYMLDHWFHSLDALNNKLSNKTHEFQSYYMFISSHISWSISQSTDQVIFINNYTKYTTYMYDLQWLYMENIGRIC